MSADGRFIDAGPGFADDATIAMVDWLSGVIWLNRSPRQWRDHVRRCATGRLSADDLLIREALVHEMAHAFQIQTMGWVYRFASTLYALALPCLDLGDPDATVVITDDTWRAVLRQFRSLDAPGSNGITARQLLEGHAHRLQLRYAAQAAGALDAPRRSRSARFESELYAVAFETASASLGDRTADLFPALAAIALCAERPGDAFDVALQVCAAADAGDHGDAGRWLVRRAAARIAEVMPFHGSAMQAYDTVPDIGVAWPAAVRRTNRLLSGPDGGTRIEDLFLSPHRYLDDVVGVRPVGLRTEGDDETIVIPSGALPQLQAELAEAAGPYPPAWRTSLADPAVLDDYLRFLGVVAGLGRVVSTVASGQPRSGPPAPPAGDRVDRDGGQEHQGGPPHPRASSGIGGQADDRSARRPHRRSH